MFYTIIATDDKGAKQVLTTDNRAEAIGAYKEMFHKSAGHAVCFRTSRENFLKQVSHHSSETIALDAQISTPTNFLDDEEEKGGAV